MRHPLFLVAAGAAGLYAVQHFFGIGVPKAAHRKG